MINLVTCFVITLLFIINLQVNDAYTSYQTPIKVKSNNFNNATNASTVTRSSLFNQLTNYSLDALSGLRPGLTSQKETIGNVVFNVHHFTQFLFEGNHIYIYSPKKNDENINEPQKWTFFYVPILKPMEESFFSPWVSINKVEVRVRLALGTSEVEQAARQAIANQFDPETVEKYSKSWVVAPLMLDSLSAYVVTVGSVPVPGVAPFHIDNPNSNIVTLRFVSLIQQVTLVVAAGLLTGDFSIEVSLYFSGMQRVRTNMITITATQLQSVLSKTTADGGGTNSTYIHRDQASSFVAKYLTNVKKLIYLENSDDNISTLTYGLEEQLIALFQQSVANAQAVIIRADAFGQVWQSTDLNPDRITSEMSKMFTWNKTETEKHNSTANYYSVNQRKDHYLPVHTPLDVRIRTLFTIVDVNINNVQHTKNNEEYEMTTHNAVSESDIIKAASQASIEGAWKGEKFIPKSFRVYKLADVVDRLQVAVIAKQLLAEKANGAVIRQVGAATSLLGSLNFFASLDDDTLLTSLTNRSLLASLINTAVSSSSTVENVPGVVNNTNERFLTGEIKLYAGSTPPPSPWLLCDGSIVSRSSYPRLFSVIGTKYSRDFNETTFQLPDLRGRIPLGVDVDQVRVRNATEAGVDGGEAKHTLTVGQLPSHVHNAGVLENSYDGQHTHRIQDPGHNHGGRTSTYAVSSSLTNDYGEYNYQTTGYREWQSYTIPASFTQITLYANGNHTHQITGNTGVVGNDESFSILPPFQTFYYMIYGD